MLLEHEDSGISSNTALARIIVAGLAVLQNCNSTKFQEFDAGGVRPFVKYASNGCYAVEIYRKKRPDESTGDGDWKMIREGRIQSYYSRPEAEEAALKLAEEIAKENNF